MLRKKSPRWIVCARANFTDAEFFSVISGNQLKAGRALAGLTQDELASAAGICPQTLNHMESSGARPALGRKASQAAVLAALGAHNVMLVPYGVVLAS
jgi:DNA-binding XRE family transcriptional regulator